MRKSLKKALWVLLVLLACSPKPATGSIAEKSLHKALVVVLFLQHQRPVRGYPFEWWRVRVWNGKYFFIYRSGFFEELKEWEVESLEKAFVTEPEMAVYITGQSQMNWGNVGEYPPYWNVESQQWGVCARVPHTHMTLANPIDLWHIWPGPKPAKGSWKDWQDAPEPPENASKWQCRWENEERDPDASSSSRPARGQSRGRSPEKHAKGSSKSFFSKRYLSRGYHSQMRREERARYRERGEPIPPHLEVQQAFVCKELKRAMWELQQQSRQNVRATCVDEIPKPEEAEDVNMEHAEEPEEAMPVRGRSREGIVGANLRQSKMGPRSLTPIGRGTPAQPAESGFLKEEMPEEAELPEEEGEYEDEEMEGAKPVEAGIHATNKKRRRRRKRKPAEAIEKLETKEDQHDGHGDQPPEEPPLPPPADEPDFTAS